MLTELFVTCSLSVNILVLLPVLFGLVRNSGWTIAAYGPPSPARGILIAIYSAIAIISALLLLSRNIAMIEALLAIQVIYKVISPLATRQWTNPVVLSNLAIAGLHCATLATLR